MKKAGWFAISGLLAAQGLAAWWLIRNSRWGAAATGYDVVREEGAFEIRQYPPLRLMSTPMRQKDDAFGRLFGYISGENEDGEKIEMTTPVLISEDRSGRSMNFVMPEPVAEAGPPFPFAPDIHEEQVSPGRFAALRYRGWSRREREIEEAGRLSRWLWTMGIEPGEERFVAYYDPPWVPGPFRRNEILFRI